MLPYENFVQKYRCLLNDYWHTISSEILEWKNNYEWPKGVHLEEAIEIRGSLENSINNDLCEFGFITKEVFDKVMKWGFGKTSKLSENEINEVTKEAFRYFRCSNDISKAVTILTRLNGIGISRASKILALSNQSKFGIYDSRAAHGLSDLLLNNKRLIPIPPGKVIEGDYMPDIGEAFEKYIYVLTFLYHCAKKDNELSDYFERVADIEIALFARSRNKTKVPETYQAPRYTGEGIDLNHTTIEEGDYFWTLSKGRKATRFFGRTFNDGLQVLTGANGKSIEFLSSSEIKDCLSYFSNKDWFPLGNNVTDISEGGLGEYFRNVLHKSPKYASHYAAAWVNQGLLGHRYGKQSRIELKVL